MSAHLPSDPKTFTRTVSILANLGGYCRGSRLGAPQFPNLGTNSSPKSKNTHHLRSNPRTSASRQATAHERPVPIPGSQGKSRLARGYRQLSSETEISVSIETTPQTHGALEVSTGRAKTIRLTAPRCAFKAPSSPTGAVQGESLPRCSGGMTAVILTLFYQLRALFHPLRYSAPCADRRVTYGRPYSNHSCTTGNP